MTSDAFHTQTKQTPRNLCSDFAAAHGDSIPQLENRSYGFKELAALYFPNIAPASASIRLKSWIKDNPELLHVLDETNYHRTARILTPLQKDMIVQAFGSPF